MIKITNKLKKEDINLMLMSLLSVCTIIPYIPGLSILKFSQYLIFIILLIINIKYIINEVFNKYKLILMFIVLISIYYGALFILDNDINYTDLKVIIAALVIYIVISTVKLPELKKEKILYKTSRVYTVATFYIIYTIKGNFTINTINDAYFYGSKNGLGPMLSLAATYLLYKFIFKKRKLIDLVFYVLSIWALCILQSRTAIISEVLATVTLFIYKIIKENTIKNALKIIIGLFLLIIVMLIIGDSILILASKILRIEEGISISNLTSGRDLAIKYGFTFFETNPILGCKYNSVITGKYASIHNLWLRSLIYGGIIYFILILGYIGSLLKRIFRDYRGSKILLYTLLLQVFVSTLFEPVSPFGPGTTYFLFWLIIGFNCNSSQNRGLNKSINTMN